jgi:hypothetical protein
MKDPEALFDSNVRGIEDLRLFKHTDGKLMFTATSYKQFIKDTISIVHGEYNLETHQLENVCGIESPTASYCEKNWVHVPGTDEYIYTWNPLRIGKIVNDKMIFVKDIPTPPLFNLFRGSAPPVEVNGKWVVLIHFVEYCTPRNYYHCFVELEKETYKVLKVSLPFFFKDKGIEFCITVEYKPETFECYVSSFDANPSKVIVKISDLEWINV